MCVCLRYYLGRRAVVVVADPDMLREIMVKQFTSFPNRMVSTHSLTHSLIFSMSTKRY